MHTEITDKTERIVISKSTKRKMNGQKHDGDDRPAKANRHTEMVVYKTPLPGGKFQSITKHEIAIRNAK